MMTKKLYDVGNRDIMNLPTYADHVSAMTGEKLNAKSDIAAELAYRDARIAELEKALDPNLFWPADDTEIGFDSVEELFGYHLCQSTKVGMRINVQQAAKLPNAIYELTELNDEDGSFEVAEVKDE